MIESSYFLVNDFTVPVPGTGSIHVNSCWCTVKSGINAVKSIPCSDIIQSSMCIDCSNQYKKWSCKTGGLNATVV